MMAAHVMMWLDDEQTYRGRGASGGRASWPWSSTLMPGDLRLGAETSCLARPMILGRASSLLLIAAGGGGGRAGGDCKVSMSVSSIFSRQLLVSCFDWLQGIISRAKQSLIF